MSAEWAPVTAANFYAWRGEVFKPFAHNYQNDYDEEPEVRVVLMRVPGKWERRVRCWSHATPKPGYMRTMGGTPVMQVEDADACPLDRGPIAYLMDFAYYSSDFDRSELAGLEWRDVPEEAK